MPRVMKPGVMRVKEVRTGQSARLHGNRGDFCDNVRRRAIARPSRSMQLGSMVTLVCRGNASDERKRRTRILIDTTISTSASMLRPSHIFEESSMLHLSQRRPVRRTHNMSWNGGPLFPC